jgi:TctA family transporter
LKIADIALGGILLAVGIATVLAVRGAAFGPRDRLGPEAFPAAIGASLLAVGVVLVARGLWSSGRHGPRWSVRGVALAVLIVAAVLFAARTWGYALALQFGPPEFVALIVFELTVAIALARLSHLRAVGMVLLGLLLAAVGVDVATGVPRLTMGLEPLFDGVPLPVVVLGVFVIADGMICLVSPSLFVAIYARQLNLTAAAELPFVPALAMRLLGALAVAVAGFYAFALNASLWDVGIAALFGAFGIACRMLGWNRLVLCLALLLGTVLEENIRRSLLLSQGDLGIFLRPISAALLLLAAAALGTAFGLSVRRRLRPE